SRFESLRNAGPSESGNVRPADVRQAFRDIPSEAQGFGDVQVRRQSLAEPPQVGLLDREFSNPQAQSTLSRFESLRNAGPSESGNVRPADVRQAFRDIPSEAQGFAGVQARRLNAQVDATIRLQRSNQGGQGNEDGVDRENPGGAETAKEISPPTVEDAPAPSVSLTVESTAVSSQTDDRPTVEQISRANTTPEIQKNLRQDASEIERGLRVDAEIQSQANLRQTAQNAERTSEARRESTVDSNDRAVRDLMIKERQLERSLRATQSEIRDLNNENNLLESSVSNVTASTAANLANRAKLIT
ncbi:MAG: hypothetical protein VX910_04965, partial [Candidatus Latescibacterota bacterium]|nr:hypothetical protein [Candidatus Latescibacterota bacterium]